MCCDHQSSNAMNWFMPVIATITLLVMCCPTEAARTRRLSAAQIRQIQERVKYMQQEMVRYQTEMATKEREFYLSFDQNGNGHLEGGEKARYDKHWRAIQTGKEANPLTTVAPIGKGPKDWKSPAATTSQSKK